VINKICLQPNVHAKAVLIHDKKSNVDDKSNNIAAQTRNQPTVTRKKRDSTINWSTCNAARLLSKVADNIVHNRDVIEYQINRKNK